MLFFNIYQYKTSIKGAFLEDLLYILGIKNVPFRVLKRIFQDKAMHICKKCLSFIILSPTRFVRCRDHHQRNLHEY